MHFFFKWSFVEIETNIWHAPSTRKSNFTSRAFFRRFYFSSFIFLFFFSRQNWLLPKTPPLLFFGLFPLFQKWFHTMSSVFIVATSQKTNDPCELNIWESNDGDQNNEKRVQLVMSTETELLFFLRLNASKRLDITQNPSRKVWLDHHRNDNKWRLRS